MKTSFKILIAAAVLLAPSASFAHGMGMMMGRTTTGPSNTSWNITANKMGTTNQELQKLDNEYDKLVGENKANTPFAKFILNKINRIEKELSRDQARSERRLVELHNRIQKLDNEYDKLVGENKANTPFAKFIAKKINELANAAVRANP